MYIIYSYKAFKHFAIKSRNSQKMFFRFLRFSLPRNQYIQTYDALFSLTYILLFLVIVIWKIKTNKMMVYLKEKLSLNL